MRGFHPFALLIFFSSMVLPMMIVNNPIYTAVSLMGALIILFLSRRGNGIVRELSGYFVVFVIMALLNPLFVHRGVTPLFFINGKAITLEALIYGIFSAMRLIAAVIWCRSFSLIMTSDRIFCLTGKLSPKISAMLTTAVRFIPDMLAQERKISAYCRSSGRFSDDSIIGRFKRVMSIFSALVTWSIESGVMTADSMKARGFEIGGRTAYSRFFYSAEDYVLIALSAVSCATVFIDSGRIAFEFYPVIIIASDSAALISASATLTAAFLFPAVFIIVIGLKRGRINEDS